MFAEEDENSDVEDEKEEQDFGFQRGRYRPYREEEKTSESGTFRLEGPQNRVNFTSLGGYTQVKEELLQVMDMLYFSTNYSQYGLRVPKGFMLEGPPGNGKTLMARCFAGQINASFISCSGAEFNEKYVGVGASRVRELFRFAKEHRPTVIFIDELDAIGRKRSSGDESSNGERDQTLNQLLVMMDGFRGEEKIIIVGATNRIDMLDKAILRPGRFDKIIHVPNPDRETRREIMKIHLEKKPIRVELDELVRMTAGFSGAMMENLLNEATLYGIRNKRLPVEREDLDFIKDRMIFGSSVGKKTVSPKTLKRVAVHESGHLIMALACEFFEKPSRVSIDTASAKSFGMTIFENTDIDEGIFLKEYLDEKLMVLLGGRAAEEIIYGHSMSSGSLSDLEAALQLSKQMIMEYGMGHQIVYPYFSEIYKKKIDEEIHRNIREAYTNCRMLLERNRPLLLRFVDELLEYKVLNQEQIRSVLIQEPLLLLTP